MRWLLLDEVIHIKKGQSAETGSRIPDAPFSAEILMLEMMAQTAGLLLGAESDYREDLIFAKIENLEFKPPFPPGEKVKIYASSSEMRPEGGWMNTSIQSLHGLVGQGRIFLMNARCLLPGHAEPVTFHEAFMNHFKVRDKVQS